MGRERNSAIACVRLLENHNEMLFDSHSVLTKNAFKSRAKLLFDEIADSGREL